MRPSVPDVHITDSQDAVLAEYRPIAAQAVLGLLFGLISPLAMIDVMLWLIPALGLLFSWLALRRIKKAGSEIGGRKMALCGLTLSVLFLAAAPSDWLAYRRMVAEEARQFSTQWFRYVTQDEPQKACQLTASPQMRRPLDKNLWTFYRNNPKERERLEDYVKSPLVRTLLALGPKAQVRFDRTVGQARSSNNDQVEQLYAVTYEEENEKKTFFVLVRSVRSKLSEGGAGWRIAAADGPVHPDAL